MKNKNLILFIVMFAMPGISQAQGRIMNAMEGQTSARNAGMGNAMMGNSSEMFLYDNLAAFSFSNRKFDAGVSTEIYPNSEVGRLRQYNLSSAYKFSGDRAVMAGFRYLGGTSIPAFNRNDDGRMIKPYEWTIDVGYSFFVIKNVVAYVSSSFFKSSVGNCNAHGVAFSAGMAYNKDLKLFKKKSLLNVGVRLMDVGKSVKFSEKGLSYDLPTSVVMGGELETELCNGHSLAYALSGRYFTTKEAHELLIGTGAEYSFKKMLFARVGYQYCREAADQLTMGIGAKYKRFKLNIAYGHAFSDYGVDRMTVSLGVEF
ncbi:MAG: PorV/PorQ family protein [Bacteroides pyogenes]|uniref:PorV/PorQ family protein n=1 Tax=Bacteroides pyogenes TaxID=310300 RepID=UPI002430FA7F|nr:PorV/PorQ family protein [Bacteroides pyogenes]MCI7070503.1 PorV/PorQ family protein [Bacteroides pyogenes]